MAKLLLGLLALVLTIFLGSPLFETVYPYSPHVQYGVTFSPQYAKYLKLDYQKTYIKVLDELKVRNLRIPTYWRILEPEPGKYDFSQTDFMLDEASKRGAKVILVLGIKQPRWPECYIPAWAKSLSVSDRRQKALEFIGETAKRYKDNLSVSAWQVENEPFLSFFGEGCDPTDINFLGKEINLVKSMSDKPIILSDSGELGSWVAPMQLSDIFGTTLYRETYNPILGYLSYPILPYLYYIKSEVIKKIFAPQNKKTIVVEMQAEPWFPDGDLTIALPQQAKLLPVEKLKSYTEYAKKTGFDEVYFWGVEWWYFMQENGFPQYVDFAKTLFR